MPTFNCSVARYIILLPLVFLIASCGGGTTSAHAPGISGSGAITPTTTLQAETANNTSASNSFSAQLNGLPAPANVSKLATNSLLYSGSTTKTYASMLGWFGESGHMNVGYNSNDPQQVKSQVEDMMSRGMQGAVLDWYGPNEATINGTAMSLRSQAEAHPGFEFAIMEDGGAMFAAAQANGCDVTTQLLSDLSYINTQYVPSPAYTRFNGRPVIYFFGVDAYYIDWSQVRSTVANNPILLFRGTDGLTRPISDGGFQWEDINADPFHPASPNPFDPALAAQSAFYQTAQTAGRLAIGSAYRGFNDSLAPWGIDRFVHPTCGQTWLATFADIANFYSSANQLPALQIVTWNDYDEGTAIEMGIDNCVYMQPSVSESTLSWTIAGGNENTIDHYTVFASTDGQNLAALGNVPAGTHSLSLSQFSLPSAYILYVQAVGKPSIQNKMSAAIAVRSGDQSPTANLSLSQTAALTFSASTAASTGSALSSMINFGDGTTVAGPNAIHTYATVGQYLITATVTDAAGSSAVAMQEISAKAAAAGVTIFSPATAAVVNWPTPTFAASANSSNPIATMSVSVDGTQIYAINQDTINTALKIYQGSHTIAVQAADSKGNASTSSVQVVAEPNDSPPIPAIQVTALPNVAPNTVLLCGAAWQDSHAFVNAYQWTFSDGTATQFNPSVVHTSPSPAIFSTTLNVIDQFGAPATITQSVNSAGAAATSQGRSVHVESPETQRQNLPTRLP